MDWGSAGLWWIAAAALLAGVELAVPGVFLIFVAAGAAITGTLTLLFPDLPAAAQVASVAAWSGVAVAVGRRWYTDLAPDSADPMLNDRAARLLGERVVVVAAIADGVGRVRVGDGEWIARGPDAPVGTAACVVGVAGNILTIEPLHSIGASA